MAARTQLHPGIVDRLGGAVHTLVVLGLGDHVSTAVLAMSNGAPPAASGAT